LPTVVAAAAAVTGDGSTPPLEGATARPTVVASHALGWPGIDTLRAPTTGPTAVAAVIVVGCEVALLGCCAVGVVVGDVLILCNAAATSAVGLIVAGSIGKLLLPIVPIVEGALTGAIVRPMPRLLERLPVLPLVVVAEGAAAEEVAED
jgi:hypothetical protein